jgi:hypothetical protein
MEKEKSWQIQLSQFSLATSSALVLFGFVGTLIAFIFSFAVNFLNYREAINNLEQWQILLGVILPTFILISISLLVSEVQVSRRVKLAAVSWNKHLLLVVSLLVTSVLLVAFYFGFSQAISIIHNNFWL